MSKWLILGICGVTCGGKTYLAKQCKKYLPNSTLISQDTYFLPVTSPKHVLIPELNHFNWEILSSLDMEKMHKDILSIINKDHPVDTNNSPDQEQEKISIDVPLESIQLLRHKFRNTNILIIEGFCIFNYEPIEKLCDLKFYISISKETVCERRFKRVYDPPDPPGYFEKVVWPEYLKHKEEIQENCKDIVYLYENNKNHLATIFEHLLQCKDL